MSKKDRTPAEIAEIRAQRERRRTVRVVVIWVIWLAVFTVGYTTGSSGLMWVAFALTMANLAVVNGLYEKSLRKIAGRPSVDYRKIRKLEKRELPEGRET